MRDHMLQTSIFLDQCEEMIFAQAEDVYFSLNSFYKPEKFGSNVRHINAMVLDLTITRMTGLWIGKLKDSIKRRYSNKLPFPPTAVLDSGRGLYVIYAFRHCSYHMESLYRAIMKAFYIRFKELCIDAGAMLITQVIRLPGTINSKSGRQVRILQYEDTDYRIQDFADMLPWTQEEVEQYRLKKKEKKKPEKEVKKDISARKPYFKDFYEDMRKLIILRNHNGQYEGYREMLLYLVRERAVWSGYTVEESVELAKKLNISSQAVSKWENAQSLPDIALLPALAGILETDIDTLMGYIPKKKMVTPYEDRYNGKEYYWGTMPNEMCMEVLRRYYPTRPLRLLEVGCGEGKDAVFFARNGYQVTAFDVTESGIEKARRLADIHQVGY